MDEPNFKRIYPYFILLAVLFFSLWAFGYLFAQLNPEFVSGISGPECKKFGFLNELNPLLVFLSTFLINSLTALIATTAGVLFGLVPVFYIAFLGSITGLVMKAVGPEMGNQQFLIRILPHFIFEITGILLACSYGLWSGKQFYRRTIKKEDISTKQVVLQTTKKFLKVVLPLLFVAAVVETFITPLIIEMT